MVAYHGDGSTHPWSDRIFRVRGDGEVTADGSFTGGGADYAEYFESTDGSAIPVGTTVVLVGQKVRAATEGEQPFGVIRPASSSTVVGNNAWDRWHMKYLKDDYGAYALEEYTITEWTDDDGNVHAYDSDKIPEYLSLIHI